MNEIEQQAILKAISDLSIEIKSEIKELKQGQQEIKEKLIAVEERVFGLEKRIDNQEAFSRIVQAGLVSGVILGAIKYFWGI